MCRFKKTLISPAHSPMCINVIAPTVLFVTYPTFQKVYIKPLFIRTSCFTLFSGIYPIAHIRTLCKGWVFHIKMPHFSLWESNFKLKWKPSNYLINGINLGSKRGLAELQNLAFSNNESLELGIPSQKRLVKRHFQEAQQLLPEVLLLTNQQNKNPTDLICNHYY